MFRKTGLLCAALAMFSIAGGHWAVLQTVAWAGMLRDYARTSGSLVTAIGQTFDGEHPCQLCQEIGVAKGREKSRSEPSSLGTAQAWKLGQNDGKCLAANDGFLPRLVARPACWFPLAHRALSSRGEPPPVPPPRLRVA